MAIECKASEGEVWRFAWRHDAKPSVWRRIEGGSEGEAEIRQWRRLGEGKTRLRRGRVEVEAKHRRDRSEDEAWPKRDRGETDARPRRGDIKAEAESWPRRGGDKAEANVGEARRSLCEAVERPMQVSARLGGAEVR